MGKGYLVCFVGIDGSGKTTLTQALRARLDQSGRSCKYIWCGWRGFRWLPFKILVSAVKAMRPGKNHKVDTGGEDKADARPGRLLFAAAWLDYLLSVFPDVLISLRRNDVVIVDRYYYDVAAGFSGGRPDMATQKLGYFRLYPVPDILFFIDISPEVAFSRKDDVPSVDYLRQKKAAYDRIVRDMNGKAVVLDGTRPKDALVEEVFQAIGTVKR